MSDLIYRQEAIEALGKDPGFKVRLFGKSYDEGRSDQWFRDVYKLTTLPSAQPFHNITMNDVLKYIDGMPEDVWQEFTACLECRGWELQRRTAKWCGGEFA